VDASKAMRNGALTPTTPGSYRAIREEADRMLKQGIGPTLAALEIALNHGARRPQLEEDVSKEARKMGW